MKVIALRAVCLAMLGCATVEFQPYEGKTILYEGQGGTKLTIHGVDIWANGEPPRKYSIIGVVVSELGSGFGDEGLIRAAVASEAKKRGGSAAIQVTNNTSFAGVVRAAPGIFMAAGVRRMQFALVRYEHE